MPKPDEDQIVARIREKFDTYSDEWQKIRSEADLDMEYVSGNPWSESDRRLREEAMRPIQVTDELHQFFNQVINDVRQNPRAVKFSPAGVGTSDQQAKFYTDKWREIEYRSKAARHYITAMENAIYRGYGWVRVNTAYASQRSKNLELRVEGIPNPNMVLPDPDSLEPDSSDCMGLFAYHSMGIDAFEKKWPNAKVQDFSPDLQKAYPRWVKGPRTVQVSEFWEVTADEKMLMLMAKEVALKHLHPRILQDSTHPVHQQLQAGMPVGAFMDELQSVPDDESIMDIVPVEDRKVTQYLTNGIELLETKPWPGKYIPFASCFGKVLYLDKGGVVERQILSMTRLARNPYMALCYLATVKLELIGMMPKFPYFVPKGTISPAMMIQLQKSLHEPVAAIEYDPFPDGAPPGQPMPPPIRQPYSPELQQIEIAYESSRRSIQAAMGITPLPTPAQRNNEKTGIAMQKIDDSGQKGSFHFKDNYDAMIGHVGRIAEDLMTPIYDTMRSTAIRDAMGNSKQVIINNPNDPNSSTKGDFLPTVSSGPSYESARNASQDFIDNLIQSPILLQAAGPQVTSKVLAMAIRLQNLGEPVDNVADLMDPPPNQQQSPAQMQMQAQQSAQQLKQMQQEMQKLQFEKQADVVKNQATLQGKQIDAQTTITEKKMDNATKITVALIASGTKTDIAQSESQLELLATGIQAAHEERLAAKEHLQSTVAKGLDHAHEVGLALQDHASATAQAEQEHRHNIQAITTQAAVTPDPEPAAPAGA